MPVIQAQSSVRAATLRTPTQTSAQQARRNQGQINVQARIKARREQRRAAAIHDDLHASYEGYVGAGYLRFMPGPVLRGERVQLERGLNALLK